jgi:hypothetical protein
MRAHGYNRFLLVGFLLGTTALVTPAAAQSFNNMATVLDVTATNTGNVSATANFGLPQVINSGIGNNIGAGAVGALATAGVNQTVSQSSVQQGTNVMTGNAALVGSITSTNKPNMAPAITSALVTVSGPVIIGTPSFNGPFTVTGGGIGNSVGPSATGAVASAGIVQSFDSNTAIDLTSLAPNLVIAGPITATNGGSYIDPGTNASVAATVAAVMFPNGLVLIGDGIGNSISARAGGATASVFISSSMLDNVQAAGGPAATNTVLTDVISATNSALVTAREGSPALQPGTIENGSGNSIGATASGAFAGAGVNQSIDFTVAPPNIAFNATPAQVYANSITTGAISAFNGKTGAVSAILGGPGLLVTSPPVPVSTQTITSGVGNSIMAQAVGAGASAGITQRFANVNATPIGIGAPFAATNSVTTDAISATNRGNVSAFASTYPAGMDPNAALISAGIGNSIGSSSVGASASLGITESVNGGQMVLGSPVDNAATANGSLTARNGGTAAITATYLTGGPNQIANGSGNSIGASAAGAVSNVFINQSIFGTITDSNSIGANTVTVQDPVPGRAIAAYTGRTTSVQASYVPVVPGPTSILDGVGNTISASAVGASVGASISSRYDNTTVVEPGLGALVPVNLIDTTKGEAANLYASNRGTVTATVNGTTGDLVIAGGSGNFIGASAVGSSAAVTVTQSVAFEAMTGTGWQAQLENVFVNSATTGAIFARNNGAVSSTLVASANVVIGGVFPNNVMTIGGVGNSISAQGVGASASASISSRIYTVDNTAPPTGLFGTSFNTVHTGDVTAVNGRAGTVMVSATLGPGGVTSISNGIGNFIGASASGASAGAGIVQSMSSSEVGVDFTTTMLPFNSVFAGNVTATNSATRTANNPTGGVNATLSSSASAQIGVNADPTFNAMNVGNSISANAVGASASATITTQLFNTTLTPGTTPAFSSNSIVALSLTSTNSGPVTATTMLLPSSGNPVAVIGGGVGNSISANATGASSIVSINQVTSNVMGANSLSNSIGTLNTLAANNVLTGPIAATNSGPVTATLGLGSIGAISSIGGGVGNSISANAVGASAGVSIAQSIASVR